MTGEILPLEEDLLNELRRYELKNEVGIPATAPLGELDTQYAIDRANSFSK